MNGYFGALSGYKFIESRHITITSKTKVYKLTRKWKPRRIRRVTEIKPNPEVMIVGNTIIGHPATIARLKVKLASASIPQVSIPQETQSSITPISPTQQAEEYISPIIQIPLACGIPKDILLNGTRYTRD